MLEDLLLMLHFFRFGLLCFGGGYMLIPLIIAEFVGDGNVFSLESFGNMVSIAQVTPGPVGINTATYVGFLQHGFIGAFFATLGLILPSLIFGSMVIRSIRKWQNTFWVQGLLRGVKLAAVAMILYASLLFLNMSVFTHTVPLAHWRKLMMGGAAALLPAGTAFSWGGIAICIACAVLIWLKKLPTTALILLSALAGLVLCR